MEFVEEQDEQPVTPEEYLAERKQSMRGKSWWAIGIGAAIVLGHLLLFAIVIFGSEDRPVVVWSDLFRSLVFILGIMAIAGGIYGLREARRLSIEDLIPTREAIEFARQIEFIKPYYTYVLVGLLVAVFVIQMVTDAEAARSLGIKSISTARAGLYKHLMFENGEWWRLLTGATVHGSFMHIFFNGYALFGFGRLIEFVSNRAHLANVMVLAALGGSVASTVFMPDTNTVGASGGILGLVGFLAVYGFRRRSQLMPGFLRAMLTNIVFVAAYGILAFSVIDNFAHLGGLLIGVAYALIFVPVNPHTNPREVHPAISIAGFVSLSVFAAGCVFSMLLIRGIVG